MKSLNLKSFILTVVAIVLAGILLIAYNDYHESSKERAKITATIDAKTKEINDFETQFLEDWNKRAAEAHYDSL